MASAGRGVSPRFEMLCVRANAGHLREWAEFHAAFLEYVAPAGWSEAIRADFRRDKNARAVCWPPPCPRAERLRLFRLRRRGRGGNGRSRRVGSDFDLARARQKDRT